MKIIALLPVKNEAWILPVYLSSVKKIADEIIVLDDNSTDGSRQILVDNNIKIIDNPYINEKYVNMSKRRNLLLSEGRKAGGTHFIWLDADETFSANFILQAKGIINKLKPGEKLWLRWIHLWKSIDKYIDGTPPFGNIYKDFIVCDDGKISYPDQFLSEQRTPGTNENINKLSEKLGVVLHFQFVNWHQVQLKQAWYRCNELIKGERNAKRINNTYSITLDNPQAKLSPVPEEWVKDIFLPKETPKSNWHLEKILAWFTEYGIEFFEPLQIWHIPELHDEFIKQIGKEPNIKIYPKWLIYLNALKNRLKNK